MLDKILAVLGGLLAFFGSIVGYGVAKKREGKNEERLDNATRQRKREAKAKRIESQPSPTDPDDVADLWSGMSDDESGLS